MSTQLICPKCGSPQIVKSGYSQIGNRRVQRYLCRTCGFVTINPRVGVVPSGPGSGREMSFDQYRSAQITAASMTTTIPEVRWWINLRLLKALNLRQALSQIVTEAARAVVATGSVLTDNEFDEVNSVAHFEITAPPKDEYVVTAKKAITEVLEKYGYKILAYSFFNVAEQCYCMHAPGGPDTAKLLRMGSRPPPEPREKRDGRVSV